MMFTVIFTMLDITCGGQLLFFVDGYACCVAGFYTVTVEGNCYK